MSGYIPTIDMVAFQTGDTAVRQSIGRMVDDGFTDSGFLVLVNHGVSSDVVRKLREESLQFFRLPAVEKLNLVSTQGFASGYTALESGSAARYGGNEPPPDRLERFSMGPFQSPRWATGQPHFSEGPNVWPTHQRNFQATAEAYYREVEVLTQSFLRLSALALRLDEDFFFPYFTPYNGVMRVNFYPRQESPALFGQQRIGEHTDTGAFTLLIADENVGGLQIKGAEGDWKDIPAQPDTYIVNIGEFLRMWTNNRWKATMHRVVNPRSESENKERISIPFFANPNPAAIVEPLATCVDPGAAPLFGPISSGEYRARRIAQQRAGAPSKAVEA